MNTQNKEPNIRFNQFKDFWKVVELDSISQKVKTKNINNKFENVLTNSAEFGIIPQRDFFDKSIANLKNLNGYYVVQPNDFVYNPRISNKAPVGPIKANFSNSTGVMSPLYYVFRTQNIDVFFLAKYFDTSYWHKFMKLNGDTGARADRFAIKDSVFKKMPIPFPSLPEQSAIGSLFCTLDDLLASYKENLANYQSLKATMLSKMFPKAGESVPEIRLDGFEEDWKSKQLKELVSEVSRKIDKPSEPYYRMSIRSHAKGTFKQLVEDPESVAMDVLFEVKLNDLVVNITFAWEHAIAVAREEDDGLLVSHRFPTFVIDNADVDFINTYIKREIFRQKMDLLSPGGAGRNRVLNKKEFVKISILIPSLPEQQAIGAYFSNLDQLITSYQEKITQIETLKKKLLQDMFI